MSSLPLNNRTAETIAYFLPPSASAKDVYCSLYGEGPFISTKSCSETTKKAKLFNPQDKLRSVLLAYTIHNEKVDPNGNRYSMIESTQFNHFEVPAGTFSDLVRCCHPKADRSVESITDVQHCWNRVFPGNLSPYNTGTPSQKDNKRALS